jgi:hypothetical protein
VLRRSLAICGLDIWCCLHCFTDILHSSARGRLQCGCLVVADALLSARLVHLAFVGILCSSWVTWYVAELNPFYLILILCPSARILGPLLRSPDRTE